MQADAPGGHGKAVEYARADQHGQRIGIGILSLIGLKDLIEVIKGLGGGDVVFLQIVLAQDQAAVVEGLVKQTGQVIALSVAQVEKIDILLQAERFNAGVEVRRPVSVVADRHDGAVERQGGVLTLYGLIEDHIRRVGAGIQRKGNLGLIIGNGNDLKVDINIILFLNGFDCQPVFFERKGRVVGVVHRDLQGLALKKIFFRHGSGGCEAEHQGKGQQPGKGTGNAFHDMNLL